MTGSSYQLAQYGPAEATHHVEAVTAIFASAFAEPPYHETTADVAAWRADWHEQLTYPGFSLVLATSASTGEKTQPLGFAYGYTMTADTLRWQKLITPYADQLPPQTISQGRVFTLMEFAVLAEYRGRGIGRALHDKLLTNRPEAAAMLTVQPEATAAQQAYKAWGWWKVGQRVKPGQPAYDVLVRGLGE